MFAEAQEESEVVSALRASLGLENNLYRVIGAITAVFDGVISEMNLYVGWTDYVIVHCEVLEFDVGDALLRILEAVYCALFLLSVLTRL